MRTPAPVLTLRWVARTWSIASIGFLCAFLFGEGLPTLTFKSALFPFGVMSGLVVAWRLERTGGVLAAISLVLFYTLEYLSQGRFPRGPWFLLIAAPGFLFIVSGCLTSRIVNNASRLGPR